jgi:hypothetical protein
MDAKVLFLEINFRRAIPETQAKKAVTEAAKDSRKSGHKNDHLVPYRCILCNLVFIYPISRAFWPTPFKNQAPPRPLFPIFLFKLALDNSNQVA